MNYSNKLLADWAEKLTRVSCFTSVLAFEYYDGPEKGLAVFETGDGLRFLAIGDSRSGLFRAFELFPIAGNWSAAFEKIQAAENGVQDHQVLFPQNCPDEVNSLEKEVFGEEVSGHYLGIGSPQFEWLYVVHLARDEIAQIRQSVTPQARFDQAHRLLKHRRLEKSMVSDR